MPHEQSLQERESLESEHLTEDEARMVVELWAEQQRERERRETMPTVQDMAEGLQIPPDEAHRLLAEVRARHPEPPQLHGVRRGGQSSYRQRTLGKRTAVAGALAVAALVTLLAAHVIVSSPGARIQAARDADLRAARAKLDAIVEMANADARTAAAARASYLRGVDTQLRVALARASTAQQIAEAQQHAVDARRKADMVFGRAFSRAQNARLRQPITSIGRDTRR